MAKLGNAEFFEIFISQRSENALFECIPDKYS
jgi:hypothetical protein